MKWVLIWICAQCSYDLQVIYGASTEANVRQVMRELDKREHGAFMVAHMSDNFQQEERLIWNEKEGRFDVTYLGTTRPYGDTVTHHRREGLELGRGRGRD